MTVGLPPIRRYVARVRYRPSRHEEHVTYELREDEHGLTETLAGYINPWDDDVSGEPDMSGAGLGDQFDSPSEAKELLARHRARCARYPNLYIDYDDCVAEVDIRQELQDRRAEYLRLAEAISVRLAFGN